MNRSFLKSLLFLITTFLYFKLSEAESNCTDTIKWDNGVYSSSGIPYFPCTGYESTWCSNGSFTVNSTWTGGTTFHYPELNCCVCGKDWSLWNIPINGSTAVQAELQSLSIKNSTSLLCQAEAYMEILHHVRWNNDFNELNCTLVTQSSNNKSYVIRILKSTHLIFFSNLSTSNTELICKSNISTTINKFVMCRFIYYQQSFNNSSCSSTNITTRHIPSECLDTANWGNGFPIGFTNGFSCFECEMLQWCANGEFIVGNSWTGGLEYNYPEYSCCACGKRFTKFSSIISTTFISNITYADLQIVHFSSCIVPSSINILPFDLTCYGPRNLSKLVSPSNFTLYGCPLTCSSTNTIDTVKISNTPPVFVSLMTNQSNITFYYLTSILFSNFIVHCLSLENEPPTSMTTISTTQSNEFILSSMAQISSLTTTIEMTSVTNIYDNVYTTISSSASTQMTWLSSTTLSANDYQFVSTTSLTLTKSLTSASIISILSTSSIQQSKFSSISLHEITPTSDRISSNINLQLYGWIAPICLNSQLGINCTVSSDPCIMAKPCLNNGTCLSNNSISYSCSCVYGFSGRFCEINIHPCTSITCLHHAICIETNLTSFACQCESSYEGNHCEIMIDYCQNITCYNKAPCRSLLRNFTCECLTSDFTGRYCEIKSSILTIHQIINRSLASVSILVISSVVDMIILMDFLKFICHIDPVKRQRVQFRRQRTLAKKKRPKPQQTKVAVRFIYVEQNEGSSK